MPGVGWADLNRLDQEHLRHPEASMCVKPSTAAVHGVDMVMGEDLITQQVRHVARAVAWASK